MSSKYYYEILQKFKQSYNRIENLRNYASPFSIIKDLCLMQPAIERLQGKKNTKVLYNLRYYFKKAVEELLYFFRDPLSTDIRKRLNEYFGNYLSNLVLLYHETRQSSMIYLRDFIKKIKEFINKKALNESTDESRSTLNTMLFTLCEELKICFNEASTGVVLFRLSLDILLMQFITYSYGVRSAHYIKQTEFCANSVHHIEKLIKENRKTVNETDLPYFIEQHYQNQGSTAYDDRKPKNNSKNIELPFDKKHKKTLESISEKDHKELTMKFFKMTKKFRSCIIENPENHGYIKSGIDKFERIVQRFLFWDDVHHEKELWDAFVRLKIINEKICRLRALKPTDSEKLNAYNAIDRYLVIVWKQVYFAFLEEMHRNMDFEHYFHLNLDEMFVNTTECLRLMREKDEMYKKATGITINRMNYALCFVRDYINRNLSTQFCIFYKEKITLIRKTYMKNLLEKFGRILCAEGAKYNRLVDEFEHLSIKIFEAYDEFKYSQSMKEPAISNLTTRDPMKGNTVVATEFKSDHKKIVTINGIVYRFGKESAFIVFLLNDSGDEVVRTMCYKNDELKDFIKYLKRLPTNTCIVVLLMTQEPLERNQLGYITVTNSKLSSMIGNTLQKLDGEPFIGVMIGYIDDVHVLSWHFEEFSILKQPEHRIVTQIPSLLEKKKLIKIELSCLSRGSSSKRSIRVNNNECITEDNEANDGIVCIQETNINSRRRVFSCSSNIISRVLNMTAKGSVIMGIMNGRLVYDSEDTNKENVEYSQYDASQTLFIAVKQNSGVLAIKKKSIVHSGDLVQHINKNFMRTQQSPFRENNELSNVIEESEEDKSMQYIMDLSQGKNNIELLPLFRTFSETHKDLSGLIHSTKMEENSELYREKGIFGSFLKISQLILHIIELTKDRGPLKTDHDLIKNCQEIKKQTEKLLIKTTPILQKCSQGPTLQQIWLSIDQMRLFSNQLHIISSANNRSDDSFIAKGAKHCAELLVTTSLNLQNSALNLFKALQSACMEYCKETVYVDSWRISKDATTHETTYEKTVAFIEKSIRDARLNKNRSGV